MKYELKIEYKDRTKLESLIQESYFSNDSRGKLIGKKGFVSIGSDDPLHIIFKGLNNITVKITNDDLIDGILRCVVNESENCVDLYPINNYCIIEDKKYSFY